MSFAFMLVCTILRGSAADVFSQKGELFPVMETEDIEGAEVALPANFAGKFALLGLATTQKAEEELRTWQVPVYNKFIRKSGMMDQMFDVKVAFIPVFTGASKAAKGSVVKKLKDNNEKLVLDHLLIYSGAKEPLNALQMEDKKSPTFYLIDRNGKVVWSVTGSFRAKYLDEIEALLIED